MILELIATGLLVYGFATSSVNANNDNYRVNNDNHISESISPNYVYNNNIIKSGFYNLRDSFDFDTLTSGAFEYDTDYTFTFEEAPSQKFLVPCWVYFSNNAGTGYRYSYLRDFTIYIDSENYQVVVDYSVYDSNQGVDTSTFYIDYLDEITDLSPNFREIIINIRSVYNFDTLYNQLFNLFFTNADNAFVESYNGYYNFASNLSTTSHPIGVFGYLNFNNNIYLGFTNTYGLGYGSTLRFDNWSNELQTYGFTTYSLPFDNSQIVSNNMLINTAKIPSSVKTYMSQIGIFSYVRDNSFDDESLPDLLLTIADIPVYFISQFLNFELFGFNLFVALASLVTLLVVIFVVRKLF